MTQTIEPSPKKSPSWVTPAIFFALAFVAGGIYCFLCQRDELFRWNSSGTNVSLSATHDVVYFLLGGLGGGFVGLFLWGLYCGIRLLIWRFKHDD
jgi:hypothetical protein